MLTAADFQLVRAVVRATSGHVIEDGKAYLVEGRLARLARAAGLGAAADVVARLRSGADPTLPLQVAEAMTVNETSFFRDGQPFEALRREVVPALVRARAAERRLRVWCAACSTGQEPYSVAMTLREHVPDLARWQVQILATDLSDAVLDRARAGRFTQMEVNRGLPPGLLAKYFDARGGEYVARDDLRRMVTFQKLNLLGPLGLSGLDVVFLRNVLIYFDLPTKAAILTRVRATLRPDGYLFLGGSESPRGLDDRFERVAWGAVSYYRPTAAAPAGPGRAG